MQLHVSKIHTPRFLVVDERERVAELGTRFLHELERPKRRYSPLSLDRYAQRLARFLHFVEQGLHSELRVDEVIESLVLDDVKDFYSELADDGLSASTVRGYEVVVKKFADWLSTAQAGRLHEVSIYAGTKWVTPSGQHVVPKFILKDTVIELLSCMHIEEHRMAAHFMYDVGARVAEVERAKKADLPNPDEYPPTVDYFPLFLRGGKGRGGVIKERYTLISRPMLARIRRYHNCMEYRSNLQWSDKEKPLFLNVDGNPLRKKAIQKAISDAVARGALPHNISSHILRHGMAASVLSSSMGKSMLDNLIMLKSLLGHQQLSTTERYTKIPVAVLQKIVEANQTLGRDRIHDAQDIVEQTLLPRRLHAKNRRGPKGMRQRPTPTFKPPSVP